MSLTQAYRGGDELQRPGWWIHFMYWPDDVERLKNAVPHTDREWDVTGKRWWIAEGYIDAVSQIFPSLESFVNQPRLL